MVTRRLLPALILVAFAFLLATQLVAQVTTGSLSGIVAGPHGSISGARVRVIAPESGAALESTTTASGGFRLASLPPGAYSVEISAPGVWRATLDKVAVAAGSETRLGTVVLSAAPMPVSAAAAPAASADPADPPPAPAPPQEAASGPFSGVELMQFPGLPENRGLDQLALQVPGVAASRDVGFSLGNPVPFSTNGLRSRNNDQQIDDQNNNENTLGGPALRIANPESTQQYAIVTYQQGSEYGRNSGAVVNVRTKSGTNAWHGSIFGTENNSVLNAMTNTQRFAGLTEPSRSNDEFGGFTIGGPIVRDKAFLFGSFDQEIVSQNTTFHSDSLTPTPAGLATLAGCFPASTGIFAVSKFGPYGNSGGNPIPTVNPATGVFVTKNVGACANVPFGGVTRTLPTPVRVFDWMVRSDIHLGSDTITARYLFQRQTSANLNFGDSAVEGYPIDLAVLSQGIQVGWTHTFSPRMVNEARASFGRLNVEFGGNSIGSVPRADRLDQAVARISFLQPDLLGFGVPIGMPQAVVQNTVQFQDNWSYAWGRHQLKAGGSLVYQRAPNRYLSAINGDYRAISWSDFLTGPIVVQAANGNPSYEFREHDLFLYFQDDWKLRSDLTVTLGLTWSYFSQPANGLHDKTVSREQDPAAAFWNPALPLDVRTVPALDTPKTNFGPNFAFAYSPQWGGFLTGNGKTVIRGGYRLLYDPAFYSIYRDLASSAPTSFRAFAVTLALPAVPTGPNVRASLGPLFAPGVFDPRSNSQYTLGQGFRPDRVHTWNFGIERELAKNTAVEVRYVGNHALDLFQSVNANPAIANLAADFPALIPAGVTPCLAPVVPTAAGRVNCNLGIVDERRNSGYSDYHALHLEFRASNLFQQLTVRTGYTWSKTTDNVSEILSTRAAGNTNAFLQNPVALTDSEHALSGLDFPHRWTLLFVEQLPFHKQQQGVSGHLLGGWGFAGNYTLTSGQLYTPSQRLFAGLYGDTTFTDLFNNDLSAARPFLGSVNAPSNTVGVFAGDACFQFPIACGLPGNLLLSLNSLNQMSPAVVTVNDVRFIVNGPMAESVFGAPFGNVPRNYARDAVTDIGNFSVFKDTKLSERVSLQLRATFLNVFNHPNFASIDPFVEDAGLHLYNRGFADPSVTPGGARSIIFGGKIIF